MIKREPSDENAITDAIHSIFSYSGFEGIIGQINETEINQECEELRLYEKYKVKDVYELFGMLDNFDEKIIELSRVFPTHKIIYLVSEYAEGNSESEGFIVQSGKILIEQAHDLSLKKQKKDNSVWNNFC